MKDDAIVKIYLGSSGWHYHTMDCPWVKSPNYISLPLNKAKKMKSQLTGNHYQPCEYILRKENT